MRPQGTVTRGTTNPNRLRRVDRWLCRRYGSLLRGADDPLVVDLGYGASPVTTVELAARLRTVRPDVRVVGLEIDPARVTAAQPFAGPGLEFRRGGFELAGLRPVIVRAFNVLRQYQESEVDGAWRVLCHALAPGGVCIDGTCDEPGRLATWITLDGAGPATLTLAAKLSTLDTPGTLAERLPKALIHHNVPGEPIHDFLAALDAAWRTAAPYATFGPRQRWTHAVTACATTWPIDHTPHTWRHGTLTLPWPAVAPHRTPAN